MVLKIGLIKEPKKKKKKVGFQFSPVLTFLLLLFFFYNFD